MFLKIHHSPELGDVVAVCDRELLNTTLVHGDILVHINDGFYGTQHATPDEVRSALEKAININLMGERAIGIAIGMGILTRTSCVMIGNVPHAQIFRI